MRRTGNNTVVRFLVATLIVSAAWVGAPTHGRIDDAYRHYRKAESKLDRGELDDALTLVNRAIESHAASGIFQMGIQPRNYFPYYLRGVIQLRLGNPDAALESFLEEQRLGAIEEVASLNAALASRIDEARALDNERPEVLITGVEIREFEFVTREGNPVEEVELLITGTAQDTRSGIRSISIAGHELALTAQDGIHNFNEYDKSYRDERGQCRESLRKSCDGRFVCHALSDLSYSVSDAVRLAELLQRRGVPPQNIALLVSGDGKHDATQANVAAAIARAQQVAGDKLLFFFSGHGMLSEDQDNLMILEDTQAWECDTDGPNESAATMLEKTSLSVTSVALAYKESRSRERFIILDACRTPVTATKSVGAIERPGFSSAGIKGIRLVLDEVKEDRGTDPIIFYSTLERKVSVEWNTKGSGYFTWFLIQGLRRDLPLDELKRFVQAGVKNQTLNDFCDRARDPASCEYLQAPYLQLPPELEQNYDLQARTFILGGG